VAVVDVSVVLQILDRVNHSLHDWK